MTQSLGLFDSFDNLDQISIESLSLWFKNPIQINQLENYLANKILYPQTISTTPADLEIDLSILREALKLTFSQTQQNNFFTDTPFLNIGLRKILIPARFLNFVGDLKKLTWAFVDALPVKAKRKDWFEDLWNIVLTSDTEETIGSLIMPEFGNLNGLMEVIISSKSYKLKMGSLMIIPCTADKCEVSYKLKQGKLLGKSENAVLVSGGRLGIMIDARKK